jgi:uncharacterized protein YndB with AHSA1/START domain
MRRIAACIAILTAGIFYYGGIMADIVSDVPIRATQESVFRAVSTPAGLDAWWTQSSAGSPTAGEEFDLGFGSGYDWRARVTRCTPNSEFELLLVQADPDWIGTRVGFVLDARGPLTQLQFYHTGWPTANEHWRVSCYCWPIYLRLLRRHLEHGETVPYEQRLDV